MDSAFVEWWTQMCEEWNAIKEEMLAVGKQPSAHDVTTEQYRRMNDRGASPFEARQRIEKFLKDGRPEEAVLVCPHIGPTGPSGWRK